MRRVNRPRRVRRRLFRRSRFRRRRRPIGSGPTAKRFFKLRSVTALVSVNTAVSQYIQNDNPNLQQEWVNIVQLFDYYRVAAIKLKFIPETNVLSLDSTTPAGYRPLYIIHDPNSIAVGTGSTGLPLTVNGTIQYENLRVKNANRPWSYYKRMVRNIPPSLANYKGYIPTESPVATQAIQITIPQFSTETTILLGSVITTFYVVARNRR